MPESTPLKKAFDRSAGFDRFFPGPGTSAAARSLKILHAVCARRKPVSAVDLSLALGMAKPTVHRLMQVLEYAGYLQREPGSKSFVAGHGQLLMAVATLANSPQRVMRRSILQSLADEIQQTCNISSLAGDAVVSIERVDTPRTEETQFEPGARAPLHCTASGKVFLSIMPANTRKHLLTSVPLKRYTKRTQVDPLSVERDLRRVRISEVGFELEEFLEGINCIAVPVFDSRGRVWATISTQASADRVDAKNMFSFVPALTRVAATISMLLGR